MDAKQEVSQFLKGRNKEDLQELVKEAQARIEELGKPKVPLIKHGDCWLSALDGRPLVALGNSKDATSIDQYGNRNHIGHEANGKWASLPGPMFNIFDDLALYGQDCEKWEIQDECDDRIVIIADDTVDLAVGNITVACMKTQWAIEFFKHGLQVAYTQLRKAQK